MLLGSINSSHAKIQFHELRFSNKARCALDSKKPTDRVFLLINNMDVARSLYRLAKSRGEDASTLTQNGIKTYRFAILKLINLIHDKLVNGDLPLIPADMSSFGTSSKRKYFSVLVKDLIFCPIKT